MGIEIPNDWLGKPIAGSLEKIMSKQAQVTTSPQPQRLVVPANINPREYIQVPQYNILIARSEIHKGKDMYETLEALASENLSMPSPAQFMRHWMNVKSAAIDKTPTLLYADGNPVSEQDTENLWQYMSSTDRQPFGGNPCWTWLNALFKENNGNLEIIQNLEVITDSNGKKALQGNSQPLDNPIRENCYVDLEFNNQGFPIRKSREREYKQGENIYFWNPRADRVAGFYANSGGAGLYCNGGPAYRGAELGGFACVAGSAPKNSGGSP